MLAPISLIVWACVAASGRSDAAGFERAVEANIPRGMSALPALPTIPALSAAAFSAKTELSPRLSSSEAAAPQVPLPQPQASPETIQAQAAARFDGGVISHAHAFDGRLYVAAWDGLHSAPLEGGEFRREPVERYYFPQSRIWEANGTLYVEGLSGVRKLENGRWKTNWTRKWGVEQRLFMKQDTLYAVVGDRLLRADPDKWEPVFWNGGKPRDIAVIDGVKHVASDTGLWVREKSGWKKALNVAMKDVFERDGRWFARANPELASGLYERFPDGWRRVSEGR